MPSSAAVGDLTTRAEIHDLVVGFYRGIIFDDLLGPVFDEVAEVDWNSHLPRLVDYWCRVLLGQPGYDGAILAPHRRVHELEHFAPELFDRWYSLWVAAIDAGWQGPIADTAKSHARKIAAMLSRQLTGDRWAAPHPEAPHPEASHREAPNREAPAGAAVGAAPTGSGSGGVA